MCTVTYIPLPAGEAMLSSNRDVPAPRSPDHVRSRKIGDTEVFYPEDRLAGGTWLAADRKGKFGCLLNGAFNPHQPGGNYRMSRGQMVIDFFRHADIPDFTAQFDFEGIEPFTFILFDGNSLVELRWDEKKLHHRPLSQSTSYIWSSTTLYTPEVQMIRDRWLEEFLREASPTPDRIRNFHREKSMGDPQNDIVMRRGDIVQTVSISHLLIKKDEIRFEYEDLVSGKEDLKVIQLDPAKTN